MLEMLREALPVLESVTVWGAVVKPMFSWPKLRPCGERLTAGADTPVPVKLSVCGLPVALSVMVSEALREPVADGVNVTLIVQLAPAPTLVWQLFVWAKSPEFVPLRAMLDMLREALPVFESITLCAALVEPVPCWPNVRLVGERLAMGADGGGGLLPPPPQATQTPTTSSAAANSQPSARRRAVAKLTSVARATSPANSQGHPMSNRKLGGTLRGGAGSTALAGPVVLIVSVAVTAVEPDRLKDPGEMVQDILSLVVLQFKYTVPVNPPRGVKVIVEVPDCPGAEMLMLDGLNERL